MPLWFLTAFVLVAPASVAPQAPASAAAPSQAAYTAEQCQRDLDTLLSHSDRSYLDARRRLEANPLVSAPAIAARLEGVPPPGPASRNRLLAVLGQFHRPEDLAVFASQLRKTALDKNAKPEDLVPWRALLREQGPAAMPALTALVGDRKLDIDVRAIILADLVEIYPLDQLDGLLALVGRGSTTLRRALHLAIRKRATAQASERAQLLAAVDAQLTANDPERLASLIRLRGSLTHRPDPAFTAKLMGLVPVPPTAGPEFPIQVVALRGLALVGQYDEQAFGHLEKIAQAHLATNQRSSQASEILGWVALAGLKPEMARPLVDRLQLITAEQPRLAALAYQVGSLPAGPWLATSQQHPWPEVRASAIDRILAPCEGDHVSKLGTIAGLRRGDEDGTVARAAILALGRCRDPDAQRQLKKLLHNQKLDVGRRAAAAWQLVKHHGNPGANEVAKALDQTPDIGMARRLIQVIGRGGLATPNVVESLCDASEITEMAADARASLVRVGASPTCD